MAFSLLFTKPDNFYSPVEAAGCYLLHKGDLLCLKRHPAKVQGDRWCVPGGKAEPGEIPVQTVQRELFEETGIQLDLSVFRFFKTVYVQRPDANTIYHMFAAELDHRPSVILGLEEHTDFRWISEPELDQLTWIYGGVECIRMFLKS